ncbi:MAG TPA: hypothetical protein VGR86_04530 [Steroidobacteraceae bacterium]|nr:hypothetical protein [Steroidobacteraceae bacterium]
MTLRPHAVRMAARCAGLCLALLAATAGAAEAGARAAQAPRTSTSAACEADAVAAIPPRAAAASPGSAVAQRAAQLSGVSRDALIRGELLAGNIPQFLRHPVPVRIAGGDRTHPLELTLCVLPDYLAVGSDRDFIFVPLGLEAALAVAQRFGFELPTPHMVDAIYAAAPVKLAPLPLPPGEEMRSTAYLVEHSQLIGEQRAALSAPLGELTAGDKKDLVLTSRLWTNPGRVAIYGWHRGVGAPIQPLSTVHGARYADYSHGVRLVSDTAYLNGVPRSLRELLAEAGPARLLTGEGPWPQLAQRLAALRDLLTARAAPR